MKCLKTFILFAFLVKLLSAGGPRIVEEETLIITMEVPPNCVRCSDVYSFAAGSFSECPCNASYGGPTKFVFAKHLEGEDEINGCCEGEWSNAAKTWSVWDMEKFPFERK
jgi:hypothetical protein